MQNKDWRNYQNRTLNAKVSSLLIEFLTKYNDIKTIVDLGCGAGNESVYFLRKGYKVTAVDRQLNKSFILDRLTEEEKNSVSFIESDFKNLILPQADCVIAMFSIPFCEPIYFDELWDKIYSSLNNNGYFVGQLFGNRDAWAKLDSVNTFTKKEVLEKLSKYEILLLDEKEYVRERDNKKWHYFNIIARKK